MPTSTIIVAAPTGRARQQRAQRTIDQARRVAPVLVANRARNARAEADRHARWTVARDAAWQLISPLIGPSSRVAIVGAGNGDTVPLGRIAAHAREVTLLDIDGLAVRAARRARPRALRSRIRAIEHDITLGAADVITRAAAAGQVPESVLVPEQPLPDSPYDLVIGDLFYSQLLYPALNDLEVSPSRTLAWLERYGPPLTRSVVSRLHLSAPFRPVIHIDDPIAWWTGHPQPVSLEQILAAAGHDPDDAVALARTAVGPHHTDPRRALHHFRIPIRHTRFWHWPFAPGVEYLAAATVAGAVISSPAGRRGSGPDRPRRRVGSDQSRSGGSGRRAGG